MTYVRKCKRTYCAVTVAMNVNIPPHPTPPPTQPHTQNIHTRMASYMVLTPKTQIGLQPADMFDLARDNAWLP